MPEASRRGAPGRRWAGRKAWWSVDGAGERLEVPARVEPLRQAQRRVGQPPAGMGRAGERADGEPHRAIVGAVDDERFFTAFRMPREGAVGEALAVLLIDDVHDATRCPDAEGAHRNGQLGGDTGN